jgi:signal transduction histidine kinase
MGEGIAPVTEPEPIDESLGHRSLLGWLGRYVRPLAVLLIAAPLTLLAVKASLVWLSVPFPSFLLMENAVVPTVSGFDWPPEKSRLFHSRVVSIDGRPVRSSADVYDYVADFPSGRTFAYAFEKGVERFQLDLPSRSFTVLDYLQVYAILLLIGVMNLVTGMVVGFMRPEARQARVYLLLAFVGCLFATTAVFLHRPEFAWLTAVYFASEAFFPATFIHLALVFPVERSFPGRRRLWIGAPYAVSAVLTTLTLRGFHADPPDLTWLHLTYLYIAASFLFFLASMVTSYRENREPLVRPRIKAMLLVVGIGGPLCVFAFSNNALAGGSFPLQLGLLFVPVFYLSLGYAIVKHDLFDIDWVVRQSFVYGLLSVIVVSGYGLVLAVPARLVPSVLGENRGLVGMVFVVLLAFALDPLRHFVQNIVDRAFYRTRLDYRTTISRLSEVMTTLLDLGEVVSQITRVVTESMHLRSATLCLFDPEGREAAEWSLGDGGDLVERSADPSVGDLGAVFERFPHEFNAHTIADRVDDADRRDAVRRFLQATGVSVVLPLMFRSRPIGFLALGPRRSGQPFSWDDITLLRTLCNQTAIAIQNARSYRELQELNRSLDAKVRQRTAELHESNEQLSIAYQDLKAAQAQLVQSEKMASLGQLVAGVAHELNNPASFVHGGIENLHENLDRFVEIIRLYEEAPLADNEYARRLAERRADMQLDLLLEETPELFRICAEGSERIRKIVDDLRVFVRADQGHRAPTDVGDGLESTIRLLSARVNNLGVAVRKDFETVPSIEAQSGQLNQVWMNLLSNALDAVEGRPSPEIQVRLRSATDPARNGDLGGPYVEVQIADNGHGIGAADLEKIFEPFFTTKPIGRGTGLGLSIVYGAVRSHGGTIQVESEPERGTLVTVRLPVQQKSVPAVIAEGAELSAPEGPS